MKKRLLAISLCTAALCACESAYPPPPPPPPTAGPSPRFHAREFAWSTERGSAGVRGVVDYVRNGHHFSCAGQTAVLTPDTPYSRWRIEELYGSAERAALPVNEVRARQANRPSDAYSAFVRRTSCDASGHFIFQGLPEGGWFVIVVSSPSGGGTPMALMRHVETRPGYVRNVVFG